MTHTDTGGWEKRFDEKFDTHFFEECLSREDLKSFIRELLADKESQAKELAELAVKTEIAGWKSQVLQMEEENWRLRTALEEIVRIVDARKAITTKYKLNDSEMVVFGQIAKEALNHKKHILSKTEGGKS